MAPDIQDKLTGFLLVTFVFGLFVLKAVSRIIKDKGILSSSNKFELRKFLYTADFFVSILIIIVAIVALSIAVSWFL
jgi:hypothetical protein